MHDPRDTFRNSRYVAAVNAHLLYTDNMFGKFACQIGHSAFACIASDETKLAGKSCRTGYAFGIGHELLQPSDAPATCRWTICIGSGQHRNVVMPWP